MISALLQALFVLLGLVVSYEDWKERKIRNRWILAGLGLCAAFLTFFLVNSALGYGGVRLASNYDEAVLLDIGHYYMPWGYYARLALHAALSFACAYALWRYSVWPAGDAKLFIVFALILPLVNPNLPGFPRMLFVVMLINIFVPAGLILSVETLVRLAARAPILARTDWRKEAHAWLDAARVRLIDHWPHRYNLLALSVNLFAFFTLFRFGQRWLLGAAAGPAGRLLVFSGLILVWSPVQRLLCNRILSACALCGLAAAALAAAFLRGVDVLAWIRLGVAMMFNFGMLLSVARVALGALAERQSLASVPADEVHAGMILAEPTWQVLRREPRLAQQLGASYCDGLTADEAQAVKSWLVLDGSRDKLAQCRFYRAVPFAAWIFLGCVLTLHCRSTIIHAAFPAARSLLRQARGAAPWWSL